MKLFRISLDKYDDQIQFGLTFSFHKHSVKRHFHIWIDLFKYYIEITIGKENE